MRPLISSAEAAAMVQDGSVVMFGGFMGCGTPHGLVEELLARGTARLTMICNDTGFPDYGTGRLVMAGRIRKTIATHIGLNPETSRRMNAGEMEVELIPQGTMAERIRAAGAGLGGILTPTGVGTVVEEGKQRITVDNRDYLLEKPLRADIALLKAHKADRAGNLIYRLSARNFNPLMAMAADTVIVEADAIVDIGRLDPDSVHTPGVFVHYLMQSRKGDG
ncbi:MAG: acetate CoA-transferase subunit alpha [Deltaproteobacteria bacterium]|jgi:acetate CoA/acetoacetate CoA-transferase alpha subunit|nr:acetate CoA-transferase subunit alpha [Deltaproteobacteria bacterium]